MDSLVFGFNGRFLDFLSDLGILLGYKLPLRCELARHWLPPDDMMTCLEIQESRTKLLLVGG